MKITPILTQLREQCPTLAHRVAAGFDLATLQAEIPLQTPCAYVLPTADIASKNAAQNVTLQAVRDRFDAVLVLDATDATKALDLLHDLRAELWRALVGFKPGAEYIGIEYDGSELVSINSSRALFRLRFFAEFQLGRNLASQPAESWHERELDGLSSFTRATVRVDAIDPADPNLKRPGPDGRVELTFSGDVTP
ncbi:phage tail terminator protein [Pseudomonas sp. RL_105y_Pfl2_101]|uniref:phage tail terminator protein n=1 Tax=Pseudomonas sp. RL_105y_Pfl2_101 TaxID=3088708 RepID=UPI0030DA6092